MEIKKLDESYNRWLKMWVELWTLVIQKCNEDLKDLIDIYINTIVSDLEKRFNLVKK